MAEPASYHQPAFEKDRELSGSHHSFLKKVGESPSKTSTGGRPPLESYLEPEETEELATTSQRIEENYPFFGTLMKRENGLMRRKEVIKRSEPKDIEYVKAKYKAGDYQLRLKTVDGEEKIDFKVSGVEPAQQVQADPQQKVIDEQFIAGLRRDIKEEIRSDYEDIVDRLEKRLRNKDDELDELSRKVRNLNSELAETERKSASNNRQTIKEFEDKIDRLKEDKRDLEFDLFELQQELKYADREGGFDLKSMLQDAASSPELRQLLAPILATLFGGNPPQSAQTAALADGARMASEQPNTNPSAEPSAPNSEQQQEQPTQKQQMEQLIKQFKTGVVRTVASSMINGEPEASQLKQLIMGGINDLKSKGIEPQSGIWIDVAKQLIEFALKNSVTAEKAAETITPILEQFDGAASQLKFIPASGAAEFLINKFGIDVTGPQKKFLIEILKVFKEQLK